MKKKSMLIISLGVLLIGCVKMADAAGVCDNFYSAYLIAKHNEDFMCSSGSSLNCQVAQQKTYFAYLKYQQCLEGQITSFVLSGKPTSPIKTGSSIKLKVSVGPNTVPDRTVVWSSSNTKIAAISGTDIWEKTITGVSAGTATITVTAQADSTKKESCTITVVGDGGTPVTPPVIPGDDPTAGDDGDADGGGGGCSSGLPLLGMLAFVPLIYFKKR
ncbi:MAG: Ig-like domain-containing protein [Cloacibacillus sp.]